MALSALAITALGVGGGGLGLQMKGQHQAGKAAERQAKNEAILQEHNAKLKEREATERQEAASVEERKHRKAGERLKARQRVQAGQAGVEPVGSLKKVQEETADELEIDALMIRRGGTVGAARLTADAQLSRLSGRSALLRGRSARRAGRIGAISSGLSGGANLGLLAASV